MCTSYTPSSLTPHRQVPLTSLCFGLSLSYSYKLHYFKPDLNTQYFKYACASNHTHKIFTLPTQPSLSCHSDMTRGLKLSYPQLPEACTSVSIWTHPQV